MLRKLTNFATEIDSANNELSATNSPPILVQRGDEPLVELQLDELEVIIILQLLLVVMALVIIFYRFAIRCVSYFYYLLRKSLVLLLIIYL